MNKEYRSVNPSELRLGDTQNGTIEGLASVKGYLDDYGTIWADKSYVGLEKTLKRGYMLDTHAASTGYTATMANTVAMLTDAYENEDGLYIVGEFHSKQPSQDVRTMAIERQSKGQHVGFSIGFERLKSYRVYPKDYAKELPKLLKPKYLSEGLERAKSFPFVEVYTETSIDEVSILLCQSHEDAIAANVRSANRSELGSCVDEGIVISGASRVLDALMYNVFYDCVCDEEPENIATNRKRIADATDAAKDYLLKLFDFLQTLESEERKAAREQIRILFKNPEGQTATQQLARLLIDVEEAKSRVEAIAKLREEARMGKALSTANHKLISEFVSKVRELNSECDGMEKFLEENNPSANEEARKRALVLRAQIVKRKLTSTN